MTREEILVRELIAARDLFQKYGDFHMAKDPPQRAKAAVNYRAVTSINNALHAEPSDLEPAGEPAPSDTPDDFPFADANDLLSVLYFFTVR